ncbi:hypothetical protein HOY80DRAFT_1001180 [Tuber brumale]|nr:hypothetical protein HOY80DRAFT_1001180 [Tuber brumale]
MPLWDMKKFWDSQYRDQPLAGQRVSISSLVPTAYDTSPIVTPATLQKLVAESPRKTKNRDNRSASNSEVLAKHGRVAGGSVVKETAISDANIPGGAVDIEDLIVKICQAIENAGSAADQAHLEQLSKDFDETNCNLAECNCWQERDRIVSGEIASNSGHEEALQVQSTASGKWFHDTEEYETGEGQVKRRGQQ